MSTSEGEERGSGEEQAETAADCLYNLAIPMIYEIPRLPTSWSMVEACTVGNLRKAKRARD